MSWELSVDEILQLLGTDTSHGEYKGTLTGIADLRSAEAGELSFLSSSKYAKYLPASKASVILVPADQEGTPADNQLWIPIESPSVALAGICSHLEKQLAPRPEAGVHPSAVIDPEASVDPGAHIGPFCVVGKGAVIGANAVLQSNVSIEHGARVGAGSTLYHGSVVAWNCVVGENCLIYHGAKIGSDGFGYHSDKTGHTRLPQIGTTVLEDNVEVGANSTIDRARFAETRIGQGTKIDNLVQVGHNVVIGKHCILCSGVGISGSTELGNFVVLAGQVGVNGHIKIADGVTATGQSGVTKDTQPGLILSGTPAGPHREEMRKQVLIRQLPDFIKRVKALEERMD
ncbi:MAG: UDP-3-O-(3-hydroxymyristoyl)glucosamine N-acyltransferase [Puniceicoccaceae bacterium]